MENYDNYSRNDLIGLVKKLQIENEDLEKLSSIDALTNVKNRGQFDNLVEDIKKNEEPSKYNRRTKKDADEKYVIFFDMNDFKNINDSKKYGYDIADQHLKLFASYLKNNFRSQDEIFRYGGDEFIVIMKNGFDKKILKEKLNDIRNKFNVSYGYVKVEKKNEFNEAFELAKNNMKDMKKNTEAPYNLFTSHQI